MWHLEGTSACFRSDTLECRFETTQPEQGLNLLRWGSIDIHGINILQCHVNQATSQVASEIEDAFVRGDDLIVSYDSSRPVQLQIRFHVTACENTAIVDGFFSVQTRLLDADPRLGISTTMPDGTWMHARREHPVGQFEKLTACHSGPVDSQSTPCAWLYRFGNYPLSFGQIMHTDFISGRVAQVPGTAGTKLETQFFPEPIEKGVLRRARIRTLFTPREDDEAVVLKHVQQLALSPPLTA